MPRSLSRVVYMSHSHITVAEGYETYITLFACPEVFLGLFTRPFNRITVAGFGHSLMLFTRPIVISLLQIEYLSGCLHAPLTVSLLKVWISLMLFTRPIVISLLQTVFLYLFTCPFNRITVAGFESSSGYLQAPELLLHPRGHQVRRGLP